MSKLTVFNGAFKLIFFRFEEPIHLRLLTSQITVVSLF